MYSWNLNGADQFKLNPSNPSTAVSLTEAEIVYKLVKISKSDTYSGNDVTSTATSVIQLHIKT